MTQVQETPFVVIEGKKYPRKEFKDLIAQIATEHNITPFTDPVMVHLFENREEQHVKGKIFRTEFEMFQAELVTKIKEYSTNALKLYASIEADEINIIKRYLQRTK